MNQFSVWTYGIKIWIFIHIKVGNNCTIVDDVVVNVLTCAHLCKWKRVCNTRKTFITNHKSKKLQKIPVTLACWKSIWSAWGNKYFHDAKSKQCFLSHSFDITSPVMIMIRGLWDLEQLRNLNSYKFNALQGTKC